MSNGPNLTEVRDAAREALDRLRAELLAMRTSVGYWEGYLSSSALSTATAVSALSAWVIHNSVSPPEVLRLIRQGLSYLVAQQNQDGGFGDTDRSHSNIATSHLVLAANALAQRALFSPTPIIDSLTTDPLDGENEPTWDARLRRYIRSAEGISGLRKRYGRDKTFVVPILTNLAIAGLVDWQNVPRLPFEAAVFPGSMYRFLRMPVVSYAIPALVAIGQAHHFCGPHAFWPIHKLRSLAVRPTMGVLSRMQPESGGYLEATPLTSFVLMSLAASGRGDHPVATRCIRFLVNSVRPDGSWPIDTNLATWVTSLAIHALAQDPDDDGSWATQGLIDWHLGCQHRHRHPFTGADPGGWGWTNLSGAVPDGDDTPAAIIAIGRYVARTGRTPVQARAKQASAAGIDWLIRLQNRDGGIPTFCRGWGKLPFDRSSTDLTAHLLRALRNSPVGSRAIANARRKALLFLSKSQHADGHWTPLWFGNQDHPNEENPIYGTSRVLLALADEPEMTRSAGRGIDYLLSSQNHDGGWGGGPSRDPWSSIEETAVAVEALSAFRHQSLPRSQGTVAGDSETSPPHSCNQTGPTRDERRQEAILRGARFLSQAIVAGHHREPWPIGFYFAKLWYHEMLYPLVMTSAALGAALRYLQESK